MKVSIVGMAALQATLKTIPIQASGAVERQLKVVAADLQGQAQRLAPIDMGDLRGSAFNEVEGESAIVGFTEPYALRQHEEVEYAHPKGGQAKYLEEPFKENADKYAESIGKAIKRAVE